MYLTEKPPKSGGQKLALSLHDENQPLNCASWLKGLKWKKVNVKVAQLRLTLWDPMDCNLPGSSVHRNSPGKNTGVGCHAFLQGIFPTQGSNPGLPHFRRILYHLSHQGRPKGLKLSLKQNPEALTYVITMNLPTSLSQMYLRPLTNQGDCVLRRRKYTDSFRVRH